MLILSEPVAAIAATGAITIAIRRAVGTFICTRRRLCAREFPRSDTADDMAAAIVAEVNDTPGLAVIASGPVTGGIVNLTTVWKGIGGNDIQVSLNYYGSRGGEQTPVGLGIDLPQGVGTPTPLPGFLSGGVGTPDLTNGILNMGEGLTILLPVH